MTSARPLDGESYHLYGIAGNGMAPLAIVARHLGATVSGCDHSARLPAPREALQAAGLHFERQHSIGHLAPGVQVVATPVAAPDEPEMLAAQASTGVWHRNDLMARVLRCRRAAGVTGTHGKGTVTALAAGALAEAGLDPLAILGVSVPALGGVARLGDGPIVAEVDDSDLSLTRVETDVAVVVNLDDDHPDKGTTLEAAVIAVGEFVSRARERVVLGPSPRADRLAARARVEVWRHGRDFSARTLSSRRGETRLALIGPDGAREEALVRLLGPRTAVNAALAFATALALGAEPAAAAAGLARVDAMSRRLEPLGVRDGVGIFDDFGGKHPVTLRGGIDALRRHFPDARVTAVFEPYGPYLGRFGRRWARALGRADRVLVLPPVFLSGYGGRSTFDPRWVEACRQRVEHVGDHEGAAREAMRPARPGDLVAFFAQVSTGAAMAQHARFGDLS